MKYQIEMEPLAGRHVVALKDSETGDLVRVFVVNASAAEMLLLYRNGLDIQLTRGTHDAKGRLAAISYENLVKHCTISETSSW